MMQDDIQSVLISEQQLADAVKNRSPGTMPIGI